MKRVTIVGSGNAFFSNNRAQACYLLENHSGEFLLLDLGASSLPELRKAEAPLSTIPHLLLTHFHGDHFGGLPYLLLEMEVVLGRKKPFTIWGPPGVEEACRALLGATYPGYEFSLLPIRYEEIRGETKIDHFRVLPFPMLHRPESLGYRIQGPSGSTFAFSGDTGICENLFPLVEGADVAVVELSMEKNSDPPISHISLTELEEIRPRLRPERLILTHIYDQLADLARKKGLGEIAEDGMRIEFPVRGREGGEAI